MALSTDLNVSPYYDDYDPKKSFYRVLFQPGVAVQARELNQLQTILQNQIEKFGDNIFKRGTIIEGCNITPHEQLPYVKIRDLETDGAPVNVDEYTGLHVRNAANVQAFIVKTIAGYESSSPNLNTLYIQYNNSGNDGNTSTFSALDNLTIYSKSYPIFKMKVIDGSSAFTNADSVVVMSAIAVQNSSGGSTFPAGAFDVNNVIQNGVANAVIIEANSTANSEVLILKVKPLTNDLLSANTIKWRFGAGETIRNANTANTANVVALVGAGAEGSLVTDSLGKIVSINVTAEGSGYYVPPHITVKIESNTSITLSEINQLAVEPLNYLTTVTVANNALSPIGSAYGVTVGEGTIYQKGFFSRVDKQLVIVNKYSNTGFDKSVGFLTKEEVVTSNQDQTLLDNATGTYNYAAPGADRLKLTPVMYVLEKAEADANTEFLPIIEYSNGRPYKSNRQTVYNVIGDEMAKRTYEESGNYVLDQFLLATKDTNTFADSSSVFWVNIDPGTAYIKGYRVQTATNFVANVAKGTDTANNNLATIRVGYGNYIRINQLGGVFPFNKGVSIDLHDTAAQYVSLSPGGTVTAAGTKIGTARIRSLVLESGEPGSPNAVYRMYLFDIVMNAGANFGNVRSVYYGGTNRGIADIILDTGSSTAILYDTKDTSLLFKTQNAMKYANNLTYTYRTVNEGETANTTGYITLNLGAGEYFPYSGTLSTPELHEVLIIPKADYQAQANASGQVATSATNTIVTGSGGMNFNTHFNVGDHIKIANSTSSIVKQIAQITSSTTLLLTTAAGTSFTGANVVLAFPKSIPISMTVNPNRSAVIEANGQMTIQLANNIANSTGSSSTANVAVVYNVTRNNVSSVTKTTNREIYARIRVSDNLGGVLGPWALGVSDAFRLRGVYQANGASRALSFNAATGILNSGTANAFIQIANNPFANGDSVQYSNTGGTTVVGGLTNSSSYYVVYANTSGFALSSSRNGANLTLTANGTSELHTMTGSPLYFTEDTYGVSEITNQYYIDTNQKEDYLDTSYLFSKPRIDSLSSNDVLLVKFDAFTTGPGVKTVSSYPINDSANLTALTTGSDINTAEIPELIGTFGKYYDLRDQFDFRPTSANTIPLTNDVSNTSILNPTEPTDANRFSSGSELYFPVPNSSLTANIAYYLGRSDRVILDKNQNFILKRGTPGDRINPPTEPADSITIQILNIPPYPSYPSALSQDMIKILDTKTATESYTKRFNNFRVKTTLSAIDRSRIQVKNYKMADIAAIERRIRDLEYYVSFTLAEAIAKARFIPSSINAALDRFRYGFFVDPFTDYTYSDIAHPEYWAVIREDMLGPKMKELNLEFMPDTLDTGMITLPYNEFNLISQLDCTDGPVTTTEEPTPTPTPTTGDVTVTTVTQNQSVVMQENKTTSHNDNGSVFEEFIYTMSSLTGPVEFYLNSRDNNMALEVFQSTTATGPWTSTVTSASAQPITSDDITSKGLSYTLNGGRTIEHPGSLNKKSYGPVGGFIEDQFKVLWTHDPNAGIYVKIRVYKGNNHGAQGQSGTYGFKMYYPSDVITNQTTTVTNPQNFQYIGTVSGVSPNSFTITMSYNYVYAGDLIGSIPLGAYVADNQKFAVSVQGLKPNTYHKFMFNGEDATSKCTQNRTSTTNTTGLLSDANGVINFDFYYDAGINEATSDLEQQNKNAAAIAGIKNFSIQSYDGNSKAAGTIDVKYYSYIDPAYLNMMSTSYLSTTNTSGTQTSVQQNDYTVTSSTTTTSTVTQQVNDAIDAQNVVTIDWAATGKTSTGYSIGNFDYDFWNIQLV